MDELLLEVLEHLPQTVRGFPGEMKACSAVFEPEAVISSYKGTMGPLSVALQKRQQMDTYCTTPLVLDFMSRKFTKGLPSLRDTEGVLENNRELSNAGKTLYGKCRVLFLQLNSPAYHTFCLEVRDDFSFLRRSERRFSLSHFLFFIAQIGIIHLSLIHI